MYAWEFGKVCAEFGVYPAIALENENIRAAVKSNDLEKIGEILKTMYGMIQSLDNSKPA